jgi:4-hydroxy-3-polyprenylbenzoate decarboxylase
MEIATYVVAITGASGSIYGRRMVEALLSLNQQVIFLVSEAAEMVIAHELDFKPSEEKKVSFRNWFGLSHDDRRLEYTDYKDLSVPLSSGSFKTAGMVIIPCSMSTLGAIANGITLNAIHRAADVTLKEERPLILAPRETPLNAIHLRNMLRIKQAGAHVVPLMPAFYHKPKAIDDLVNFMVGKILDLLDIEHNLYKRWQEEK